MDNEQKRIIDNYKNNDEIVTEANTNLENVLDFDIYSEILNLFIVDIVIDLYLDT